MDQSQIRVKQTITRLVAVAASGLILGYLLYRSSIFIPTMKASQFTSSSVTIAIAYTAWKAHALRNGFAALFVWYIVLTTMIVQFNSWLLILASFYIAGMAGAVLLHQSAVVPRLGSYPVLRVLLSGALTSIANGLIVSVLFLFSFRLILAHLDTAYDTVYYNLKVGALIGLGVGIGMEIAEHLIARFLQLPDEPSEHHHAPPTVAP
jgi:hypothetical protein